MTQCDKIQKLLGLSVLGDLTPHEAQEFNWHLGQCFSCQQDLQDMKGLILRLQDWQVPSAGDVAFVRQRREIQQCLSEASEATDLLVSELQNLPIPQQDEAFFSRQRESLWSTLRSETAEFAEWDTLAAELKHLPQSEKSEAFFEQQRQGIVAQLASETSASTHAELATALQSLEVNDPGDLFFLRQAKNIRGQLPIREEHLGWRAWTKPLAVAAALFFLIIGVSRVNRDPLPIPSQQWRAALEYMANEEEDSVGLEAIDELNHDQLERLANNIEGRILVESGEQWMEEPVDLEDLNEQEIQLLIQRLENKVQT